MIVLIILIIVVSILIASYIEEGIDNLGDFICVILLAGTDLLFIILYFGLVSEGKGWI